MTAWGKKHGFDVFFMEQKVSIVKNVFSADWDKGLLAINQHIGGQLVNSVAKKYLYESHVEPMRAAAAGTWRADLAKLFDDMVTMNEKLAKALDLTLDPKPTACAMLSGALSKLLGGKIAKVTDHKDSLNVSTNKDGKPCKRVKIMYYGGGADMERDLVFIFMGKVIGGVTVEAGDIVISSDAFLDSNPWGLLHSSRLRGGGGPSGLLTFYADLPDDTEVVELLSQLELPTAECVYATDTTLRVLEK